MADTARLFKESQRRSKIIEIARVTPTIPALIAGGFNPTKRQYVVTDGIQKMAAIFGNGTQSRMLGATLSKILTMKKVIMATIVTCEPEAESIWIKPLLENALFSSLLISALSPKIIPL